MGRRANRPYRRNPNNKRKKENGRKIIIRTTQLITATGKVHKRVLKLVGRSLNRNRIFA